MSNAQSTRFRLGPQMIALFGSVLRDGGRARDVDVTYFGVEPHVAAQAAEAWVRKHRPWMVRPREDGVPMLFDGILVPVL